MLIKSIHQSRRHKGYRSQGLISSGPRARRFSNRQFLLAVAAVAVGVALLTWGLSVAQGTL